MAERPMRSSDACAVDQCGRHGGHESRCINHTGVAPVWACWRHIDQAVAAVRAMCKALHNDGKCAVTSTLR